MKRTFLASVALLALSAFTPAVAGEGFAQIGLGGGTGSAFSESTSTGLSATGSLGGGSAEHSSFNAATNLSSASLGSHFGGGKISVETETLSQGETLSRSNGWSNGSAISVGGGLGAQNGGAWADGKFGTVFGFGRLGH